MCVCRARDYSAPVNFISAGLKKGAAEEADSEDSDAEEKPVKQEDFPKAILKYPELNLIYCRAKYDKNHDEYSQELLDYLDVMLALRREEMGQESKDADS